jgi:hypothetical protein
VWGNFLFFMCALFSCFYCFRTSWADIHVMYNIFLHNLCSMIWASLSECAAWVFVCVCEWEWERLWHLFTSINNERNKNYYMLFMAHSWRRWIWWVHVWMEMKQHNNYFPPLYALKCIMLCRTCCFKVPCNVSHYIKAPSLHYLWYLCARLCCFLFSPKSCSLCILAGIYLRIKWDKLTYCCCLKSLQILCLFKATKDSNIEMKVGLMSLGLLPFPLYLQNSS